MKNKQSLVYLTQAAVIAAAYTALTLIFQPISYGPVQFRIAEALTILPIFMPAAIPGLTLGCFLANLFGMAANPAGVWDLLFGPLATLLAALLTHGLRHIRIGKLPVLSSLPPVLFNGLIVGTELYFVYGGMPWILDVVWVAIGEAGACVICGLLLAVIWERVQPLRQITK